MSRLIIRHHRPRFLILVGTILIATIVVGGWAIFDYGLRQAGFEQENLAHKEGQWLGQKSTLEQEIVGQREHISRLEQGHQVDLEAYQHLQNEVVRLHDEVSNLKDELTFYRDIVAPDNDKEGLSVRGFLISRLGEQGGYRYKIVITKVPNDGNLIRGNLTFEIEGREKGKVKRYNLKQISQSKNPTERISFRFKYFQNLGGELHLPEGFKPTKVTLTLRPKGKKLKKSVEQFDWIVEES